MDTTDWSPNVDKFLDVKYDADTVDEGKALAKETLQAELGLPVSTCKHALQELRIAECMMVRMSGVGCRGDKSRA